MPVQLATGWMAWMSVAPVGRRCTARMWPNWQSLQCCNCGQEHWAIVL